MRFSLGSTLIPQMVSELERQRERDPRTFTYRNETLSNPVSELNIHAASTLKTTVPKDAEEGLITYCTF